MNEKNIQKVKATFIKLFPGEESLIAKGFDKINAAEKSLASTQSYYNELRETINGMSIEQVTGTPDVYKNARIEKLDSLISSGNMPTEDLAQIHGARNFGGDTDETDHEVERRISELKNEILNMPEENALKEMREIAASIRIMPLFAERVRLCEEELKALKSAALLPFFERVNAMSDIETREYKKAYEIAQIDKARNFGGDTDETDHEVARLAGDVVDKSSTSSFDIKQDIYKKCTEAGLFDELPHPGYNEMELLTNRSIYLDDFSKIAFCAAGSINPTEDINRLIELIKVHFAINIRKASLVEKLDNIDDMPSAIKNYLSTLKIEKHEDDFSTGNKLRYLSNAMRDYTLAHGDVSHEISNVICCNSDLIECLKIYETYYSRASKLSAQEMQLIIRQLETCLNYREDAAEALNTCKELFSSYSKRAESFFRLIRNPKRDYNLMLRIEEEFHRALQIIINSYQERLFNLFYTEKTISAPKYYSTEQQKTDLYISMGSGKPPLSISKKGLAPLQEYLQTQNKALDEVNKKVSELLQEFYKIEEDRTANYEQMKKEFSVDFSSLGLGHFLDIINPEFDNEMLQWLIFKAAGYETYRKLKEEIKEMATANSIAKEAELRGITVDEVRAERTSKQEQSTRKAAKKS